MSHYQGIKYYKMSKRKSYMMWLGTRKGITSKDNNWYTNMNSVIFGNP